MADRCRAGRGHRTGARRARALVAVLGAIVVVALGACGRPARLDAARTEAAVADQVEEIFDVTVSGVTCPDIEVEEDRTDRCTVAVAAGSVPVDVVQSDGAGTLVVEPRAAVVVRSRVEEDLAAELVARSSRDEVEVTCAGPSQRVLAPKSTVRCTADDGEEEIEVVVRVRDGRGALAFELPD